MKVCVCMGFQYQTPANIDINGVDNSLYLPGIYVDLYQAYCFAKKMKPDKIVVLTDIEEDSNLVLSTKAISEGIIDADILNFIYTLKENGTYAKYEGVSSMISLITEYIYGADELFFYYTGHSENGTIILPINVDLASTELTHVGLSRCDSIRIIDLRDLITTSTKRSAQIFIVMDCCNGNGLGLPFRLRPNGVISTSSKVLRSPSLMAAEYKWKYQNDDSLERKFPGQEIICMSSATENEFSVTTRSGSIFTRSVFKYLEIYRISKISDLDFEVRDGRYRSISFILHSILIECQTKEKRHVQTSTAYSSYPNLNYLWPWLWDEQRTKISISPLFSVIEVRRKETSKNLEDAFGLCT
jgi:hypothetical protein